MMLAGAAIGFWVEWRGISSRDLRLPLLGPIIGSVVGLIGEILLRRHFSLESVRFSLRTMFVAMSVLAFGIVAYSRWPVDGLFEYVRYIGRTDTMWAAGFSDEAFQSVHLGMTQEEVYTLLGPPLRKESWEKECSVEYWTANGSKSHYRLREVGFCRGRVVYKVARIYSDE
jgi:hypothetical protein